MSHDQIDDETLAAFLDGQLNESERARVMRVLADSPDSFAAFREAASVADALHSSPTSGRVLARSQWRRRALIAVPVLAAAGIAGIIIARDVQAPEAVKLAQNVASLPSGGVGAVEREMGPNWLHPAWGVNRGTGGTGAEGAALRLGARFTQLELAASAADSNAWREVAGALISQLASVDAAGPVAATLERTRIPESGDRATLAMQLRALSGSPFAFELGVWMEAARLSAMLGRVSWFAPNSAARRVIGALVSKQSPSALQATIEVLAPFAEPGTSIGNAPAIIANLDSAFARVPR